MDNNDFEKEKEEKGMTLISSENIDVKELEETEELLIIVDMVNGFVRFGNLFSIRIGNIVPVVANLAKLFSEGENRKIVFANDGHTMNSRELLRFLVHCLIGTPEAEVIDELKKYMNGAIVYEKNSTEATSHKIMELVKLMPKLKRIVVVGCCTDICVKNLAIALMNAIENADLDIEVVVPENAVETFDGPDHDAEEYTKWAFNFMRLNGVKVVKKYEMKRGA